MMGSRAATGQISSGRIGTMNYIVKSLSSIILLGFLLAIAPSYATSKETTCPVMEGTVNKNIYADYKGKRVYFCCPPCLKAFKKDPDTYMKKLEDQGVVLEKAPEPKTP
jgi:YHS domain-containing protein